MTVNGYDWKTAFWSKVCKRGPDECWLWTGSRSEKNYGWFRFEGKTQRAHRIVFFLTHGRWPKPQCCHRCDNPPCCNPEHLFEGTARDNARDAIHKGRITGLTDEQRIAALARPRQSHHKTARRMGVGWPAVYRLRRDERQPVCHEQRSDVTPAGG